MEQTNEAFAFQEEPKETITIDQVHEFINNLKQRTVEGFQDGIVAYSILSDIENNAKLSKADVKEAALLEASKYEAKSFEHKGLKVQRKNGSAKWDFKGMPEWENNKSEKAEIEKEYKARHALYLKGKVSYDEETGEQLPVPSLTYSEDSLTIKPL